MVRLAPQQRRIKRREIRTEFEVLVLHRRPGAVAQERREHDDNEDCLDPPRVAALGVAPAARQDLDGYRLHSVSSERFERPERPERPERFERLERYCAGTISTAARAHSPTTVRYRRTPSVPITYGCFSPALRAFIAGSFVLLPS